VQYKVLFMGRHGEGYHNVAEAYYGTPAWNVRPPQSTPIITITDFNNFKSQCYYSKLDGNGTVVWADAHLTPNGVVQAQKAHAFWSSRIQVQKIPTPQSYYTRPLSRCLQTANITFSRLQLPSRHPFIPEVKELFREGISGHTCDRRSSKTYIHENFPSYRIEDGFTEIDELWVALHGETDVGEDIRSKKVLDRVFGADDNTWISITSHSGEIASILRGRFLCWL
jgi:broad specificity phosphatase PhoE